MILNRLSRLFDRDTTRVNKDLKEQQFNFGSTIFFLDESEWRNSGSFGEGKIVDSDEGWSDEGWSISSFSTTATMDDNPGPGRTLDKCYQYLGRKIERSIFRFSIYTLHPTRIFQCLWKEGDSWYGGDGRRLSDVMENIHVWKGPASVAGLKSLTQQTQWVKVQAGIDEAEDRRRSESVYRSAAALAALVRLCMSNYDFNEFYISVAAVEPIFHLDSLVKALDESHPKKKLFLSLTTLARVPLHFIKNPKQFKSHSEFAHTLRQSLLIIYELSRCVTLSHLKYCTYEQHLSR